MSGGDLGGDLPPPLHAGRLVVRREEPWGELACVSCPSPRKGGGSRCPRQFQGGSPGGPVVGEAYPKGRDRLPQPQPRMGISNTRITVFVFASLAKTGGISRVERSVAAARVGACKSGHVLAGEHQDTFARSADSSATARPTRRTRPRRGSLLPFFQRHQVDAFTFAARSTVGMSSCATKAAASISAISGATCE